MFPEGIAMPASPSLALVQVASRSEFSARHPLRVVEATSTDRFISIDEITREQIRDCPHLADLASLDATKYLAENMGMPGLVKGVEYGSGMLAFSENLKYYTRVCSSRVTENKIKFNHGAEEIKEERSNCWEFCVKRQRVKIITKYTIADTVEYPLVLSRPHNPECPICFDPLTGKTVSCNAGHQVCLSCFNLLPNKSHCLPIIKACPLCNKPNYSTDEYDKVERMNGIKTTTSKFFSMTLKAPNSFKEYTYNEALFLGMIKLHARYNHLDRFRIMLMSSLHNFYTTHKNRYSDYNFNLTHYSTEYNRRYDPEHDTLGEVFQDYINNINTPEIYNDVAYTEFYCGGYDDIQFYRELEEIEGNMNRIKDYPNSQKDILKREIYFRYKVKHSDANELIQYFKNIFERILNSEHRFITTFEYIDIEE